MCFLNYNNMSDSEISEKIQIITKKLNSAYQTSISRDYIVNLENSLQTLYDIQDERQFMSSEEKKNNTGIVMETDPELADNEVIVNKKDNTDTQKTEKRVFTGPKIVKTYMTNQEKE